MAYKYIPSRFMLDTSYYDKELADRAIMFISCLHHTKGKWAHKPFKLMGWQEQVIRDIFGIVKKKDRKRQFRVAYVEIPKKNGKSELAAAIALYLLYCDGEASPEVYGAACDRQQASIVYDVAKYMVNDSPALSGISKILAATKRLACPKNDGFYQVLSAESKTKDGYNISGLVFDELHAQPDRRLFDVLTRGSGDAREQPLFFLITTAGNNTHSICYEQHCKAREILKGNKSDPSFYPVIYGLESDDDWTDEKNWYKANPSLGETVDIDRVRDAYLSCIDNPAEENTFKQLRLNMWVSSLVTWIPEQVYDRGNKDLDISTLNGRACYAGMDLSSTGDITAIALTFPPRNDSEDYIILPFFWIPEESLQYRCRRDHVHYDLWEKQGYIEMTDGNVIDYRAIREKLISLREIYDIREIAYDRWNATEIVQNLDGDGFTMVPFGQGFRDMSPAAKEFYQYMLAGRINHLGNPVLRWMAGNVVIDQDPAGNIKPNKGRSTEKIDGIIATIMGLHRSIIHDNDVSVYDDRGLLTF